MGWRDWRPGKPRTAQYWEAAPIFPVNVRRCILTDSVPKPPAVIQNEVKNAGGNRRWIAGDALRLKQFKDLYEAAKGKSEG